MKPNDIVSLKGTKYHNRNSDNRETVVVMVFVQLEQRLQLTLS